MTIDTRLDGTGREKFGIGKLLFDASAADVVLVLPETPDDTISAGMVLLIDSITEIDGKKIVTLVYGLGLADPAGTKIAGNQILHFKFYAPTDGDLDSITSKGQLLITGWVAYSEGETGSATIDVRTNNVSAVIDDGDTMLSMSLVITSSHYGEGAAAGYFDRTLLLSAFVDKLQVKLVDVTGFTKLTVGLICVLAATAYAPMTIAIPSMSPMVGVPYSRVFTVVGGSDGALNVFAPDLPDGLSITLISGRTFTVAGTPTTAGDAPGTFTVNDLGSAQSQTFPYELEVVAAMGYEGEWDGGGSVPETYADKLIALGANFYFPMDELSGSTFTDLVSAKTTYGHSGITPGGAPLFAATAASATYSGSNVAYLAADAAWDTDTFTVGCFMSTTAGSGARVMIGRDNAARQFWLYHDGAAFLMLVLGAFGVRFVTYTPPGNINDGNPHLCMAAYDGSEVHLWVDGVPGASSSYGTPGTLGTTASPGSGTPMTFGKREGGNDFTGQMAATFYIPSVLTDADVAALWDLRDAP